MLFALAAYTINYNEMLRNQITRRLMKKYYLVLIMTAASVANYNVKGMISLIQLSNQHVIV